MYSDVEISILDFGIGNPKSVLNMLNKLGIPGKIVSNFLDVEKSQALILPGVGHFGRAMELLSQLNLVQPIQNLSAAGKPILGICLGMQLLCNGSEEGGIQGLGIVDADVIKFKNLEPGLKTPNVGWRSVLIKNKDLQVGYPDDPRFYFTHSYYVKCNKLQDEIIRAEYGHSYTAGLKSANTYGFQFHPEKSHEFGMRLLANLYTELNAT